MACIEVMLAVDIAHIIFKYRSVIISWSWLPEEVFGNALKIDALTIASAPGAGKNKSHVSP